MEYFFSIVNQTTLLIMLAAAFNVLFGYAGQASMATAAFYGIAAYAAGRLALPLATGEPIPGILPGFGVPLLVALLGAIVIAALASTIIALPALFRVSGDYLILLTLAFQLVASQLFVALPDVTGGANGLVAVPPITVFGEVLSKPSEALLVLVPVALVVVLLCAYMGRSPYGRLLRAIREHDTAVRASGKSSSLPKLSAFIVAGGIMGIVGGLNSAYYQVVTPTTFDLNLSVLIVSIVVLGGTGNQLGAVIAAIVLASVQPITQSIAGDSSLQWQGIAYGIALILMIRFRPQGLLPEGFRIGKLIIRRPRREAAGPPAGIPSTAPAAATSMVAETVERPIAPTAARSLASGDPVLVVRGVEKSFGGVKAVQGVDFDLPERLVTGLVGPNGAGKTTVFNLITNAIRPDSGTVELRGQDISNLSTVEIARRGMARSFQDGRLFIQMTALDNVAVAVPHQPGETPWGLIARPLATARRERVVTKAALDALDAVGIAHRANEIVGNLSYGEQRLVVIARLIATECDVLLLDEPTAGVDPGSLEGVIAAVRNLKDLGKTVCLVEHSIHTMGQLADHILFMDRGRVIASGSLAELMDDPELTEIYFGT